VSRFRWREGAENNFEAQSEDIETKRKYKKGVELKV
jgi:hypothetical protein